MTSEEKAIVVDYMPKGKSSSAKSEPLAQVVGKDYFTLLEVIPKAGVSLTVGEEVYVGKENRDKIELVKGRIAYKDLTSNALSELEEIVNKIVNANKEKALAFYNTSRGISLKRHQLELLPGMGKKHMLALLNEREKKPFASLEDIVARVAAMPDPIKCVVKRIMEELETPEDKHYLFVRPPAEPRTDFYGSRGGQDSRGPRDFSRDRYPRRQ